MGGDKHLVVKGLAGLGNRMLAALTGILYAKLSGRRLIIDWSDRTYSVDGSNAFHTFFMCPLCDTSDDIPITDSVMPEVWRGRLREFATNMRKPYKNIREFEKKTSINLAKIDYTEDVLVMWTYNQKIDLLRDHFKGEFKEMKQMSNAVILRKLLREDLILQPLIRNRVNEFKHERFSKKTVGVHVRYSDHRVNIWSIIRKLNSLLRLVPGLQIFLATDNVQIKRMFEENFHGVISTPHWYPEPGSRLHDNRRCPEPQESGIEALVDLYLLAECDYLIIDSSSTFSELANLLSAAPASNVYDLKRGDKLTPFMRRMTWKAMLRLGLFSWGLNIASMLHRANQYFKR
jgi:hypothetical protein